MRRVLLVVGFVVLLVVLSLVRGLVVGCRGLSARRRAGSCSCSRAAGVGLVRVLGWHGSRVVVGMRGVLPYGCAGMMGVFGLAFGGVVVETGGLLMGSTLTLAVSSCKGGVGRSTFAAALALTAAETARAVWLDDSDTDLPAVFGAPGLPSFHDATAVLAPRVVFGPLDSAPSADPDCVVITDQLGGAHYHVHVIRGCYLALRRFVDTDWAQKVDGIVLFGEEGRSLGADDVANVCGAPVVATVPVRASAARAIDAGVLVSRLPDELHYAADIVLGFAASASMRGVS